MGVLTDFVVADSANAQRVGDCLNPSQEIGGINAKGIDQVKMGTLYAILTGKERDPRFMIDEASFLYSASDDGRWVQLVPPDMVTQLAKLGDHELPKIAGEWGQTEEFEPKYSGWSADAIERILRDLVVLSRRATDEGKSVLMWMCL